MHTASSAVIVKGHVEYSLRCYEHEHFPHKNAFEQEPSKVDRLHITQIKA